MSRAFHRDAYLTATLTVVDMAGHDPDFATRNTTVQVVARAGATRRPAEMEQAPDSRHVFLPRDGVVTIEVSDVRDRRATVDRLTVNPGRVSNSVAVGEKAPPTCVRMENT